MKRSIRHRNKCTLTHLHSPNNFLSKKHTSRNSRKQHTLRNISYMLMNLNTHSSCQDKLCISHLEKWSIRWDIPSTNFPLYIIHNKIIGKDNNFLLARSAMVNNLSSCLCLRRLCNLLSNYCKSHFANKILDCISSNLEDYLRCKYCN